MKKPILLIIAALLSCISGMLAQNVWDNSACLYQSNTTEVILRANISTGTIIFYTVNEELFLNKFNDAGDPTIDEPLSMGLGLNGEKVFNITSSANNTFLIGWKDADNIKVQKFDANGTSEWGTPLAISITDSADYIIRESVILATETQLDLVINYRYAEYDGRIVQYQVDISNSTPQFASPLVIYDGDYPKYLNGISTSGGITLMWVIPNEDKLAIYKNEQIHEIAISNYSNWLIPHGGTGRIIELNDVTTVFALKSRGAFGYGNGDSHIYIYNEVDSTLTNIYLESAVMDVFKISDNEFLTVTMSPWNMIFTKYDGSGDVISSTEADSPFQSIWSDDDIYSDVINSIDSQITGNNLKIGMASTGEPFSQNGGTKFAMYDYNLVTEECSVIDNSFSSAQLMSNSSQFLLLKPTGVSLLHNINFGFYSAYKQYSYPYQEDSETIVNSYEICKSYNSHIYKLQSFPWQQNNHVLMRVGSSMLEADISANAEVESLSSIPTEVSHFQVHELSPDNYLLHHANYDYKRRDQKAKLYKNDGTTDSYYLQPSSLDWYIFSSLSDVANGNGWFAYEGYGHSFHKIENNILQEEVIYPVPDLEIQKLIAMQDNYLIIRVDNEFRLTKIDNSGNIASDWEQLGETFTSDFDTSSENAQLRPYQNKLIFSYRTNEAYKRFIIDPVNLDETVAYTLPSNPDVCQQEFIIGNRFYFIDNYDNNLTMHCYDLENDFAQVWVKVVANNVRSNFAIKKLDNRFVIAYPQGEEGSEKVYLRTVSFRGNSDQYEEGYALPLNWARQYAPSITIADNNSVYVNRIENNSKNIPGVFTDLIDLSYFVPNSSEDVAPMVAQVSNYPNPFNPETTISFAVPQTGKVKIDVYNIKGQKVKTLVNEHRTAGQHSVVWNGTDNDNKQVSSGVYLYKMKSGKFSTTNKMILMK